MGEPTHIAESTIYSTQDYDKFNFIDGNRTVSKSHLRTLISSLSNAPDLARTRPILVNSAFEIIDGQHRFEASKALNIPVYYTVANNINIATARTLNAAQRGWTVKQFLDSFVASGAPQYIKFAEILEEFPLPLYDLMIYLSGHQGKALGKSFKNGDFKIMKDKELAMDRLEKLRDLAAYIDFWRDDGMCMAFLGVIKRPDYDHDRMCSHMKMAGMKRQATQRDYLRELERVYNWNIKNPENFARFF